ncbi:hypothetical protein DVK02_02970 [Halobellus sp. Atlit-31R]|nr:hypothetical protein DVK02_02970 [Halobellus sp. Atlit-31R]
MRSLAVTTGDVIDALESASRSRRTIVLRVTPPFSGRMRARIHDVGVVGPDEESEAVAKPGAGRAADIDAADGDASPIHLDPERFVADPPPYPTVDDTEDELRASETPYTRDRHRDRHQAAVDEWRATVGTRLVEELTLTTDAGAHTVSVAYLG